MAPVDGATRAKHSIQWANTSGSWGNTSYCQDLRPSMDDRARDAHSVGCYFCGVEFDEREGQEAGPFNNEDGGTICGPCARARAYNSKESADKEANA